MIGRLTRLLAGLILIALTTLVPVTASAIGPDCKDAPAPEAPGTGIGGWFISEPKQLPTGEAWQNNAPVFDHYGYAGFRWNTYDLGCGSDIARNPGAVIGTEISNWLYQVPKAAVGLTNFLVRHAFHPTFFGVFDPFIIKAMNALRTALFNQWVFVALAIAGLWMLWKIQKLRLSTGFTMIGWALLVLVLAAAVFQWPLRAGQFADQTVTTTLGAVNRGINGTDASKDPAIEVAQNLNNAILFEQWKTGQFGDSDSATANKYARAMWESQTLTWADTKTIASDPDGAGKRLLDFKAKQYEQTAEKVKNEDPSAYEYLTGKRGDDRFGAAFMALFGAVVACPFLLVSCLLILGAFLLVRFAVIFFPAIATLSVAYQFRGMLKGLLNAVAAAILNCIIFGAGAAVTIMATGVLLSPSNQLDPALRLILLSLVTFIMWVVLKPFRRLTQMVSKNHNLFTGAATALSDTSRSVSKQVVQLGKSAVGSYLGNLVADKAAEKRKEKKAKDEKVAEEETVIEPDTTPSSPDVVSQPIELSPARQPVAQLGTRPTHTEPGPYERPAAHEPDPVPGSPIHPAVATRPAHTEVGPFEATQTGGAVVPVTAVVNEPLGADRTTVVDRPEYAGGSVIPDHHKPSGATPATRDVWTPETSQPTTHDHQDSAGPTDLTPVSPIVGENGEPVWPIWTPDTGVSFDDAQTVTFDRPETGPGERS